MGLLALLIGRASAVTLTTGDILVPHYPTGRLFVANPSTGTLTLVTAGGNLSEPSFVAMEAAGAILVADYSGRIVRVAPLSGDQTLLASGGYLTNLWGMALEPGGEGSGQGVCKSQGRATGFRSHDQRVVLGICSGFSGAWQTASMRWPSGSTTKAA